MLKSTDEKRCFKQDVKNLTSQVKTQSRTPSQTGLTIGKATVTNTAGLHQMSRSVLTGKEDKSLAVNSHPDFEIKTNF